MKKRILFILAISTILFSYLFFFNLRNVFAENNGAFIGIKKTKTCGENLGPTPTEGDDNAAIAGTIFFDKTDENDKEVFKKNPDLLRRIPIYLYKAGDYASNGQGTYYCKEQTGNNGGYRFDNVEPGEYIIVVWEEEDPDSETAITNRLKKTFCSGVSIVPVVGTFGSMFCGMLLPQKKILIKGTDTVTKVEGEKTEVKGPAIFINRISSGISSVFGDILLIINSAILGISNFLIGFINEHLLIIENLSKTEGVVKGWQTVRDTSNVLLVLGLLLIALFNAIRFNIEYYTAKALIPRVVIAAIFINFSFLLTQAIVDLANVLTAYFTAGTNFTKMLPTSSISSGFLSSLGLSAGGLALFLFLPFISLVALIAILTLLTILIVRVVLIYILAVFSPLVFLFSVLPFTRGLTGLWWRYATRWIFMGPVIALLLNIASKI